jgi:hypothetical protein
MIKALRPSVKTDYLMAEVMSKFVSNDTDPPETRRVRAINKWLASEAENKSTTERLQYVHEEYNILPRVSFRRFVDRCRDIIRDIIGDTPDVEALIGSFSGGASTSRSRTESHPASKYLGKAHVTPTARKLFDDFVVPEIPSWLGTEHELERVVVQGNVLFTVPKKTDIDRVACKEPDLNMFMQKGIGNVFRRRLRSVGINLNDQSINRSLARTGSITNELATLDLSSASDSVTTELVRLLLPRRWFALLDSVRSPVTVIDGVEHRNVMFSSMGNGFTFELESLLFYAIVRTVTYFRGVTGVVSVYGDDIICPTIDVHYVIWALQFMGFQVNPDKSHISGPFRESCGGHYHNGYDVTPFYLKGPLEYLSDVIDLANKLRKWAHDNPTSNILNPEVEDIWFWLKSIVPSNLWGGVDTSFKYQLVSHGDLTSHRLHPESKKKETGTGGYLHWLNATWERTSLPGWDIPYHLDTIEVITSRRSLDAHRARLKKVRNPAVTQLQAVFPREIT